MATIISVHSFRGGTGKSNTTANITAQLALRGLRVGLVDLDIQSPGIHVLFGLSEDDIGKALNDYLWGTCQIEEAAQDVTERSSAGISVPGRIFLVPSSIKPNEIARVLREGYDVGLLNDGFQRLIQELELDVLMIDTHPGVNEETLLSIAMSDALVIIMRPDQQDYQGTAVTVDVALKLGVPQLLMVINKVPEMFDQQQIKEHAEQTYGCEVAAVLPHSDQLMGLASGGVFSLRYPDHPLTENYRHLAEALLPSE